jgi:DNA-binding response OmpR family regulator
MNEGRWILIVEDDESYAQILCAKLSLMAFYPIVAPTLNAAIVVLRDNPIETCLLDLRLPDSDTVQTLSRIPLFKTLGVRFVVVLTGAVITPDVENLAAISGADGVISKDDKSFKDRLQELLASRGERGDSSGVQTPNTP